MDTPPPLPTVSRSKVCKKGSSLPVTWLTSHQKKSNREAGNGKGKREKATKLIPTVRYTLPTLDLRRTDEHTITRSQLKATSNSISSLKLSTPYLRFKKCFLALNVSPAQIYIYIYTTIHNAYSSVCIYTACAYSDWPFVLGFLVRSKKIWVRLRVKFHHVFQPLITVTILLSRLYLHHLHS